MKAFIMSYVSDSEESDVENFEAILNKQEALVNHFTTGKSFDELEETKVANDVATGIRFAFDFQLHRDGLLKLQEVGARIESSQCVLQHRHVTYVFAYVITVVRDVKPEGLVCHLGLEPSGATFHYAYDSEAGGVLSGYRPPAPELLNVSMKIDGYGRALNLVPETDGSYSTGATVFILSELLKVTQNGFAAMHVEMTVAEDYFDMAKYIDLNLHQPPAAPNTERLVEKILEGERVPDSDWVITVGDASRHDFHVHGSVLTGASLVLRESLSRRVSVGDGLLKMVPDENRFILAGLKAEDMRLLLTLIYHRRHVLPPFDAYNRVGPILKLLFPTELANIFKHWEAAMVKNVLQLDKTKYVKTIAKCVKVLMMVEALPPGAVLAAFNTALVVGADAWQMAEARGKMVTSEKVKKAVDRDWPMDDSLLDFLDGFKRNVCAVAKSKIVH